MAIPQEKLNDDGSSCIRRLIIKGKERGYVTIGEVMECMPPMLAESQINEIVETIEDMGLEVVR